MGNFDGSTKRCLGDPGAEIRRTIRPRRVVVVVEVLGSEEKEGKKGGFLSPRQASPFVFSTLPPSLLPPTPSIFYAGGKAKKKRGAVKLERVPDI